MPLQRWRWPSLPPSVSRWRSLSAPWPVESGFAHACDIINDRFNVLSHQILGTLRIGAVEDGSHDVADGQYFMGNDLGELVGHGLLALQEYPLHQKGQPGSDSTDGRSRSGQSSWWPSPQSARTPEESTSFERSTIRAFERGRTRSRSKAGINDKAELRIAALQEDSVEQAFVCHQLIRHHSLDVE